jgi:hypothetical protein
MSSVQSRTRFIIAVTAVVLSFLAADAHAGLACVAPTVTSVSPNNGATTGGTAVTITGTNFGAPVTVTFGGVAATSVVVVNTTTITAVTPAGAAGPVAVAVTNCGGTGTLANGFTFAPAAVPAMSGMHLAMLGASLALVGAIVMKR